MQTHLSAGIVCISICLWSCQSAPDQALDTGDYEKPRVIVLTDIGNEPDDAQSLVRFLVYSNEFDVEGILATTSNWLKNEVQTDRIRGHVEAFGQVRDYLSVHAPGYPQVDELMSVVKECIPVYGMEAVGDGKQSEGSDHIISVVDKADERPVWITIWGGANCLAQALWDVRNTRSIAELDTFVSKIRVYTISDQDDSGPWIREQFPNLFYIVTPSSPFDGDDYKYATWVGISGDHFHGNFTGPDFVIVDNPWLSEHIRTGHGPLGERYPATAYLMEGDTPSFLNLIPNGLAGHIEPSYGGWGGRYRLYRPEGEPRPIWTNDDDTVVAYDGNTYTTNHATVWRWREGYQNDFAARMDWSNTSLFTEANHNPEPVVNDIPGKAPVYLKVEPGDVVQLRAGGTSDPDEADTLTFLWWIYAEAGTYTGTVEIDQPAAEHVTITIPSDGAGSTIHVILEVTDSGSPTLKGYRRIVISVS